MRFLSVLPLLFLFACGGVPDGGVKVPVNTDSLSKQKAAPARDEAVSEAKIVRVVIIERPVESGNVEYSDELYIPPEAAPFVKSSARAPRPAAPARKGSVNFLATIIYHSDNKADMSERDRRAISEVAVFARERDARLKVYGHASLPGTMRGNFEVSKRRALAVKGELLKDGVEKERVRAFALGSRRPVVDALDDLAGALNRRTEIYARY